MPDFVIENWRYGLDTRKNELTAQPGTLQTLNNCHINQGGEIEKRLAFVQGGLLPTNSFGMIATSAGLVVFGSVAQGSLSPSLPAGVSYQRLQHPDGSTAMTQVVKATLFHGAAFVIAKFSDGNSYCYYNGTLVSDFTSGLVLASQNTTEKINTALAALVNATGIYTSTDNGDSTQDVLNVPGSQYVTNISKVSTSGTLTGAVQNTGVAPTSAAQSIGQFSIQGGSSNPGTNKITSVKVDTQELLTGPGTAVNWTTSNAATAALLVTAINAYTGTSGYTAQANGNTVYIYGSLASGSTPNGKVVKVTCAGNVVIGILSFTLALNTGATSFTTSTKVFVDGVDITNGGVAWTTDLTTTVAAIVTAINGFSGTSGYNSVRVGTSIYLSKLVTASNDAPASVTVNVGTGGVVTFGSAPALQVLASPSSVAWDGNQVLSGHPLQSVSTTCTVAGGLGPYSFFWTEAAPSSGGKWVPVTPTAPTTVFKWTGFLLPSFTGTFVCQVTDAEGSTGTSNIVQAKYQ